jgi:hypothetical protein
MVSLILTWAAASLVPVDTDLLPWARLTGDVNGKALMSGGRSRRRIAERRRPSDVVRVGSARARDVSMVVRTDRRVLDVAPPAGAVHEPDRPTSRCRAPSVI